MKNYKKEQKILSDELKKLGKNDISSNFEALSNNLKFCNQLDIKEERLKNIAEFENIIEFAKEYKINNLLPGTYISLAQRL